MTAVPAPGSWRFSAGRIRPTNGTGIVATLSEYAREQQVVDGTLMAAAPDLYEAALDAASALEGLLGRWMSGHLDAPNAFAMIASEITKLNHAARLAWAH